MSALKNGELILTRPARGSLWVIATVGLELYQY